MNGALAILVKTPGLSPVKTRLQARRGRKFAEQWHVQAARACASIAADLADRSGLSAYWAVAESNAMTHPMWSAMPCLLQGEGGLGARMAQVHSVLVERHGFGMLVGADSPQMSVEPLLTALQWLQAPQPRCVLGFAEDGGFWLYGGNRVVPHHAWDSVRYGSRDTGRDFHQVMAQHGECMHVSPLRDVDHDDDLPHVFEALNTLPTPTFAQQALTEWLGSHLDGASPALSQDDRPVPLAMQTASGDDH